MNENEKGILKPNEKVCDGCQSLTDQGKIIRQAPTKAVEQEPRQAIKGRSRRRKRIVIIR
jgi:hypothetical protein